MMTKKNSGFLFAPIIILIIAALIVGFVCGGFHMSVEYTGGALVSVEIGEEFRSEDVRAQVEAIDGVGGDIKVVQKEGNTADIFIQDVGEMEPEAIEKAVANVLAERYAQAAGVQMQTLGASAKGGSILYAALAVLVGLLVFAIYMWIRTTFPSAVQCLLMALHDVILTAAAVCALRITVNTAAVAALVVAVVYAALMHAGLLSKQMDNLKKYPAKRYTASDIMAISIKEYHTTVLIAGMIMVILAVLIAVLGTKEMGFFAVPVLIGTISTTYSTLLLAPAVWMRRSAASAKKRK